MTRKGVTWREADSSAIERVGWNGNQRGVVIRFRKDGSEYRFDITRQRAVAMLLSKSAGKYFNKKVRSHASI